MVIDVETSPMGICANRTSMSSVLDTATPQRPTSPRLPYARATWRRPFQRRVFVHRHPLATSPFLHFTLELLARHTRELYEQTTTTHYGRHRRADDGRMRREYEGRNSSRDSMKVSY